MFRSCWMSEVLNKEVAECPSSEICKNVLHKSFGKRERSLGQTDGQEKFLRSLLAPVFLIP